MGRHTSVNERLKLGSRGLRLSARLALVAALVVAVIGAAVLVGPRDALGKLPWAAEPPCPEEKVELLVEPELRSAVTDILAPLQNSELPGERCMVASVRGQQAVETVAGASILPPDHAPQVWIPDSMSWVEQVSKWSMRRGAPLVSSPLVVATSKAAADQLGWTKVTPSWNEALRGKRPMAVPDIESEANSLTALIALWQTLGKGPEADQAVVNVVLAADRGEVPTAEAAFAAARSGAVNSPVVPSTEQQVAATNLETGTPNVIAVYPREGTPMMDYPVMRVSNGAESTSRALAVKRVMDRLASPAAREIARRAGFRDPTGRPGMGAGISQGPVKRLASPARPEVDGMVGRIENLARPSRLLAVIDVSLSMQVKLDDGTSRIALAGGAARLGADLLPDRSSVGAWTFASRMKGDRDWRPLAEVAPLGSISKTGQSHRAYLMQLTSNLSRHLKGGGTSLYDVTIAASREMHRTYDPKAVNAIILMSDGANEDDTGATLEEVLTELRSANAGRQKVAIYTAGLGPDADFDSLRKIAEASGGATYRIDNAPQGQTSLLDGLRRSRGLGR